MHVQGYTLFYVYYSKQSVDYMSKHLTGNAVGEMAVACFKRMLQILSKCLQVQPVFELCYELAVSIDVPAVDMAHKRLLFCAWIIALICTFKSSESDKPSKIYKADFCVESRIAEN